MFTPQCIVQESKNMATRLAFSGVAQESEWAHKWDHSPVTYSVIRGTEDLPGESVERLMVNLAMTTWDAEIKTLLTWVRRDANPDITIEWRRQEEDDLFKSRNGVLAYAYYPKTGKEGEIVFNDNFIWGPKDGIVDRRNPDGTISRVKQYNAIHTLIHEIGHSLGLVHDEAHQDSVMFPFYNGKLELSENDIARIVAKYGEQDWTPYLKQRFKRWLSLRKLRF